MQKMKLLQKLSKNKKAYFFALDAFLALLIILGVVLFIKPSTTQISKEVHSQEDLLVVLSALKIGDINNSYVEQLIVDGNITNLNQSVLEQIGEFYANSDSRANTLAQNILDNLNLSSNIGLYFNGITIATSGNVAYGNAEDIWTSRQIISGIQAGTSATGYSSRAFLYSENKINYFYFGGYVGDGNITAYLGENVSSASIEAVFSRDFDLYINGVYIANYSPTADIPYSIDLSSYSVLFSSGDNYIDFTSNQSLYIAGGYIRVVYDSSESLSSDNKYYLPGIEGIINFYDSFYVPGDLNSMEIFLHYNSSYDIFLNIGNTSIYSDNSAGLNESVTISDVQLSALLNYSDMSNATIPLRLGLDNVSYISNGTVNADAFSVTDLSGSMDVGCSGVSPWWCCWTNNCDIQSVCETTCSGTYEDKIGMAKQANDAFIDAVLNSSGNNVGLVGYANTAPDSDYHELSNDSVSLKAEVTGWIASGATCICCGINKASDKIIAEANNDSFHSMIVMSDGEANRVCAEQGTGNSKNDAIQAACDAYNDYGIKVYAVGFGTGADQTTLQSIASCGQGNYYYGNISQLITIYEQVAQDIIEASYSEQTVVGVNISTQLYPDSYIFVDYEKDIPYGLIITAETSDFGNNISQGTFNVPSDTTPYEVRALSYSGSKWTDKVEINYSGAWQSVFDMSIYNSTYIGLGDPYVVNIPLDKIVQGNNTVKVTTGINSLNSSGGSLYNKIIYSLVKNVSAYSPIVASAQGCNWTIEFEDNTNTTIKIPSDYLGNASCYYISASSPSYNPNDALQVAIYNLLTSIDLNSNQKIESKFSESDVSINAIEVSGIPFTWETEVQARIWR